MMNFRYPSSFFLFLPFAFVIFLYIWSRWKRQRDLLKLGDWRLVKELVPLEGLRRRKKKDIVSLVGLAFVILAACGPQFGSKLQEVRHTGVDVFICLDTSLSMLAEDVQPNRLDHAKRSLKLLASKLQGNRVGIIAFAGYAVIQCPLTIDTDAVQMFLDILDTKTVPDQGTAIGDAIRLALKGFKKEDKFGKAVIILTDGEDHKSQPEEAAKMAAEMGVNIFAIGIGTPKGEVIKDRDEQGKVVAFHKHEGEMVVSRLDDALLSQITQLTDGKYFRASTSGSEIDEIAGILNGFDKREFAAKIYMRLQERFGIFALIGLLLLLIEFFFGEKPGQLRRILDEFKNIQLPKKWGIKAGIIILSLIVFQGFAHANLKEHVRRGNKLVKNGDLAGARVEFENAQIDSPDEAFLSYNIAATYLMEGKFDEAQKYYEKATVMAKNPVLKSYIAYNQGYLNFLKGDRDGAVEKFKECLKINPKDIDAKYNIEYIKAGKTPKQPFQPQPQGGKPNQDKDKDSQQDKKEGSGESQQDESQKEEQKSDMSKEDAERVLQMIQDEEGKNLKNAKPLSSGAKEKEKNESTGMDW